MELTAAEKVELTRAWQNGDQEAFSRLYDYTVDKVYRYVYFKVKRHEAEDLVETTFLKAWEKRRTFNADKSSFTTWLFTIARNTVIDFYRAQKEVVGLEEASYLPDEKQDTPKQAAEKSLNTDNLRLALNYLQEPYREIVILRFLEDFSYAEIAEVMGKTESAVRVMNFRGVKKLRQIMDDLEITL